ncbi:hypothetical protein [Stackebrandtia soli]|uniref:hypothetical protein n=1 Tax=Stackebrandtia soli TaxID=1892856 RepID=UPI0039EC3CCE
MSNLATFFVLFGGMATVVTLACSFFAWVIIRVGDARYHRREPARIRRHRRAVRDHYGRAVAEALALNETGDTQPLDRGWLPPRPTAHRGFHRRREGLPRDGRPLDEREAGVWSEIVQHETSASGWFDIPTTTEETP